MPYYDDPYGVRPEDAAMQAPMQEPMPQAPLPPEFYLGQEAQQDLIRFQLELNDTIENIEHYLRGDIPTIKERKKTWKPGTPEDSLLNEKGINEILRILHTYLNKNTILSNLDELKINEICTVLGTEINDLIFMRYDEYGMDTKEKRKSYPLLVYNITYPIYFTMRRALGGGERAGLKESRMVMQQAPLMPPQMPQRQGFFSRLNPFGRRNY